MEGLLRSPAVKDRAVGRSRVWVDVLRQVVEMASFTDASILITGETGTGKELLARLIHDLDRRSEKGEFVILDCTTIVPELSGSEFFGHERGAFTGAISTRDGAFAMANRGTLFLDEVGELPLQLQAQLLRVIQEGTYKRVGGNKWFTTRFRLLCATNRDLLSAVKEGRFRYDLYCRIAGWVCRLPSLNERRDDILSLVHHFMRQFHPHTDPPELDEAVRRYLVERQYPGNVRELKQLVSCIMYRHVGQGPVTVGDIPVEERPVAGMNTGAWMDGAFERSIHTALSCGIGLKEIRRHTEDIAVRIALSEEDGNIQRAARRLGITDRALQMRLANQRTDGNPLLCKR